MNEQENMLNELLEDIYRKYGYDFREYSKSSACRRIRHRMSLAGLSSITDLHRKVIQDADFADLLIKDFSVNVTEMFRDPAFFMALRGQVMPTLGGRPFLKIWHAGCATGEEAYSMAIILSEMGLYDRSQIFATDYNAAALHKAQKGIFPLDRMRSYIANYQDAGGIRDFADYYIAKYGSAIMRWSLKKNIIFTNHDLTQDGTFSEVQVIVCRNVLIYFNRTLQQRVFDLFFESLEPGGFLCLGSQETIRFSRYAEHYDIVNKNLRIYQKRLQPPQQPATEKGCPYHD